MTARMTREDVAGVVAAANGWEAFPQGRELDTFMTCVDEAERRAAKQYDALHERYLALNDRAGNAEWREGVIRKQLEFLKQFGK